MDNLVTLKQAEELKHLGFIGPTIRSAYKIGGEEKYRLQSTIYIVRNTKSSKRLLCVPTVDEAIDFLRRKYNVIIYDRIEPFVDPHNLTSGSKKIYYSYAVKYCNKHWGWNQRKYLGSSDTSTNYYAMKRAAIRLAIRYIKSEKLKSHGNNKKR